MSGHSKWATTHRQKSAADAKRGAVFTKLANLITLAAKKGGDPESNFQLRLVIEKARTANMPKDNIERAIKRGTGEGDADLRLEEITYEIFGPSGTAFIAEGITDNKNRTVSDLKAVLNKNNGQLAGPNSVAWMFDKKGVIRATTNNNDEEAVSLKLIEVGADDWDKDENDWEIFTAIDQLQRIESELKANGFTIQESTLAYLPKDEIAINNPEEQEKIEKLFSAIEDLDDINNVYTNANW